MLGDMEGTGEIVNVFFTEAQMINVGVPVVVDNTFCPQGKTCNKPAKGQWESYICARARYWYSVGGGGGGRVECGVTHKHK